MGIAHSTPPLDALFDNQTWVKEHASDLFPDNPKKTFEYVKNHHPFVAVPSPFPHSHRHIKSPKRLTYWQSMQMR